MFILVFMVFPFCCEGGRPLYSRDGFEDFIGTRNAFVIGPDYRKAYEGNIILFHISIAQGKGKVNIYSGISLKGLEGNERQDIKARVFWRQKQNETFWQQTKELQNPL